MTEIEDLGKKPCVAMYGPCNIRNLKGGETKLWCACGLSKNQPWCDGSHKGTGIKPMVWKVPVKEVGGGNQTMYALCACKYTVSPPYCDGTHIHLPIEYLKQQQECTEDHSIKEKMCTGCGWKRPEEEEEAP
ncbi:uncharacterized protein VTP21DRAFT_5269 [Calcarisporiella thermophila]|uniref:uncharacterized protein n=1 Tax=Calcarisporiella thermophila TaxID=911321 RepID=UPI0037440CA6